MKKSAKQAVLLIHGIGEQRPMDTLRGFVRTVWTSDRAVQHPHAEPGVFSKPDEISGNYELRRLTTTQNLNGVRTDFYEFYWAHLMGGTAFTHIVSWLWFLIRRWPWQVPPRLRNAWVVLVAVTVLVVMLGIQLVAPDLLGLPAWFTSLAGAAVVFGVVPLLNDIVGDAARYLHPRPANIQRRQEIRARGVAILKALHDADIYDRIVVVGHSLGSVIGYDLLTHAWPSYAEQVHKTKKNPVLDAFEAELDTLVASTPAFQDRQRDLLDELQARGCPWRVTDFVTLGSPLAHADILLAGNMGELESKQAERELPTCPPVLENGRISYPHKLVRRRLHHAAVFGPTRWSNLYFPGRRLIIGDVVGGPLGDLFGRGIADYPVQTALRRGLVSHTLYWAMGDEATPGMHVEQLRKAVNLLDRRHAAPASDVDR